MPRQVEVTARPTDDFHVENSDGYALYSSLLARMQDADEETSAHVHDSGYPPRKSQKEVFCKDSVSNMVEPYSSTH